MLHIVLFEPEIPPNTGNIIRLSANTGFTLHLIEPIGFSLSEKACRRAGLDYSEIARVTVYPTLDSCLHLLQSANTRVYACSTRGHLIYTEPHYQPGDVLLFGPETRGLPVSVLQDRRIEATIRIPMQQASRSLNLSNSVAIVVYETWRQLGFTLAP